jgi:DNA-binding LacI/PurR family transcriptional regulator
MEIGRRAFQLLLEAMNSKDKDEAESSECLVKLEAELKIGQSTAPPRSK